MLFIMFTDTNKPIFLKLCQTNCCQDLNRKLNTPPFTSCFCGAGTSNTSGAPPFTSCFCGAGTSNTSGAPQFTSCFCGAGTSNPSGAPQFTSCFCGVRVDQSLVFCEVFSWSLFVFLSLIFCPFYCLSFFDLRLMITPNFSYIIIYSRCHWYLIAME